MVYKNATYDPPYESPIEDLFAWHIVKYLNWQTNLIKQYPISTKFGSYRIDFVLELHNNKIGIECDGKRYHENERDLWRDSMIIGESEIKEILRFTGTNITFHIEECIFIISKLHAKYFDNRGITNINILADDYVQNEDFYDLHPLSTMDYIYKNEESEDNITHIKITRLCDEVKILNWKIYYDFAINSNLNDLDQIIKLYKK
jgi:hypothetical protein